MIEDLEPLMWIVVMIEPFNYRGPLTGNSGPRERIFRYNKPKHVEC